MWQKKIFYQIMAGLVIVLLLSACGQMMKEEAMPPLPEKKENTQNVNKEKPVDNKETQENKENKDNKTESTGKMEVQSEENSKITSQAIVESEWKDLKDVDAILSQMTLEEKVGQMFMARVPDNMQIEKLRQYHLGAYLLFGKDFKDKTKDQVIAMTKSFQENSNLPLWLAVDEEGGVVNRVSRNPNLRLTPFGSPQTLYKNGGFERIHSDTGQKAELLLSLGINLNMAPVLDVPEKASDFIYSRALSTDVTLVTQYAEQMVKDMNALKIASVLKHFPGYGSNVDTHTEFAVDNREIKALKERDLLPFIAGINSGADAILVSHNIIAKLDADMPASLSPKVNALLRKELKFKGVIITDDLLMDAVKKLMPESDAAVQAVLAGNDMLCSTSFEVQIPAVIQAVKEGKIPEKQINESVKRILLWKKKFLVQPEETKK